MLFEGSSCSISLEKESVAQATSYKAVQVGSTWLTRIFNLPASRPSFILNLE